MWTTTGHPSFRLKGIIVSVLIFLCSFYWIVDGRSSEASSSSKFRRDRSRLCQNAPTDGAPYRFHKETRRCYETGQKGPCPELMRFYSEDDTFGSCDCDHTQRCGRPLVYWPAQDRCFFIHDQGPCRPGKWLVFGFDLHPVCRKHTCLQLEEQNPSYGAKYWFTLNHTCYRTFTQGYCSQPEEQLFNMQLHYRPTCQKQPDCGKVESVTSLSCFPGQKMDVMGLCKRRFLPLTNETKSDLHIQVTPKPTNIYCLFCNNGRMGEVPTTLHDNKRRDRVV